jgi:hypothetical protein
MRAALARMAAAALLGMASGAACACPEKLPAGMSAVTVGESVVVNGMGVSILQVESRQDVAALFKRIEKEWTAAGFAVKRNQAEGWNVLSALSDKCLTTLQLVDRSGAFGYLAVNRLAKPRASGLPAAPLPSGAKVLSTVLSDDDGRKGSTTMLQASQSVEELTEFYQRRLADERWASVRAMGIKGRDNKFSGSSVSAQRGRERIEVVIVHEAGSKVVINLASEL